MKTSRNVTRFAVVLFLSIVFTYSADTQPIFRDRAAITRPVTREEAGKVTGERDLDIQVTTGLTAQELWEKLFTDTLPSGVTINNLTYDGRDYASGSYSNMDTIDGVVPGDGILLTSGHADTAKGPNNQVGATFWNNAGGDPDLEAIAGDNEHASLDKSIFTVEFTTDTSVHGITFDFVFGSEEYDEWVGMFNDVFCAFLDGENICYDNTGELISVNNAFFQVENLDFFGDINLQYDGFTCVLRTSDSIYAGSHTLKFAISDIRDKNLDSGVFLHNFRFSFTQQGTNPVKELIGDQTFAVMENSPAGTFVGKVIEKVPDTIDVVLEVIEGVPEFDFNPDDTTITVANGADLDYEKQNVYTMKIEATIYDTIHDTATITIHILDYNVGDLISDQTFYVKEKSPAGTFVGEVALNVADSFNVSLTVTQGVPEFDFDDGTREITVANGADLDYEKQDTYYMTILAQAIEALDDEALITIKILDSLEIPNPPAIDSAVIYDANGDGIGDSLHVVFKGDLNVFMPHEADLEWPNNGLSYNLSIQASNVNGNELSLPFTPANNAEVLTKGVGNVTVYFDSTDVSFEKKGPVLDGIGPLLQDTAYVVERFGPGVDTFLVTFTEEVAVDEITGESFILLKGGEEIILSVIGTAVDLGGEIEVSFVADLNGEIPENGDSLKILHRGPVVDTRDNSAHRDNTPVPIAILKRPVPVSSASYYDPDGDGIVDQVRITFEKDIEDPQSLKAQFTWLTDGEDGTVDGLEYYNTSDHKILKADIEDIFDNLLRDRTSGEMEMALEYKEFGVTVDHPVSDRAGPVITAATYYPNGYVNDDGVEEGFDTLIVDFSEEVNDINSQRPFDLFAVESNSFYHFKLKQMTHNKDRITFEVENIIDIEYPIDGDSIWIDYAEDVSDVKDNAQEVQDNKRVRLKVKEKPFIFVITVLGPVDPINNKIPDILLSDMTIENGVVIILDPIVEIPDDKMALTKVSIEIFDAVGNYIAACKGFNDNNNILQMDIVTLEGKNKIVILWSGENSIGRAVGSGSYLGSIHILYPRGNSAVENVMIGVKK